MKLLVLNYEYPPLGGGAGVISQNIAERLASMGHNVTVVTAWYKTEKETEQAGNLKIIRLKSRREYTYKSSVPEMISWIKESKKFLNDYCRKEKFDLCFANFAIPGGIVALNLKRKFGLKYTVISHGHDIPWRFPEQMLHFHIVTYFRIKKICLESELNFVQTEEMKHNIDRFLGKTNASKNKLIPNGADTRLFKPDYNERSKQFKIVFIGRLVKQKDPFTFLKSVELYSRRNRDFKVHIIGDGILREKMEKFVRDNGLKDIVKFLGWISKQGMVKEYQSAHVNIITSVFEGMSVAALESLACGCFLISTPIDGIPSIISHNRNGVIVKFHSAAEIVDQIEDYYKNKFLRNFKVTHEVLNNLCTHYNWDSIVNEYDISFKQLLV